MKKILLITSIIGALFSSQKEEVKVNLTPYLNEAGYKFVLEIDDEASKREVGVKFSSINIIEKFTTKEKKFSFFINSYKGLLEYEGYRDLVISYSSSLGQKEFTYKVLGAKEAVKLVGEEKVDLVKSDDSYSFGFNYVVNDDFLIVKNAYMKLDGFLEVKSNLDPSKFKYSYTYLDEEHILDVKYVKESNKYVLTSSKVRFDDDSIDYIDIKIKGEIAYKFEISYRYELTYSSLDAFSHLEFNIL